MDSTIDRVLSFYVKINGTTNYHDIDKAINFIYEKVYISVEDNITKKTVEYMDPFNYSHRYIKDKIEGKTIELMFYPPSNRFYNSKDVLKYME